MSGRVKLSNSFSNPSLTRKRMIMMTRQRSSVLTNLKILAAIPVILITFLAVSASGTLRNNVASDGSALNSARASENASGADETPFVVVEEMPLFPGGDQALLKYIASHTVYPEAAKQNDIQGRVIVRFCVTSKGAVEKVSILEGINPLLDNEALRVTQSLPAFKPGRQGGKPVPVWYMIPVTFTLR
jgi:protein TonB